MKNTVKTSISLPIDLVKEIKVFNAIHVKRPISIPGVCTEALERELEERTKQE